MRPLLAGRKRGVASSGTTTKQRCNSRCGRQDGRWLGPLDNLRRIHRRRNALGIGQVVGLVDARVDAGLVDVLGVGLLGLELRLGDAGTHGRGRGGAARRDAHLLVHELCTRPVLVPEQLDAGLALGALDHVDVGVHAALGVALDKLVGDEPVGVEAGQGDELPDEAAAAKLAGEGLHLVLGHAGRVPVERGRQVVRQHLARVGRVDAGRKLVGLRQDGLGRLHPQQVGVGRVGLGAGDGHIGAGLEAVVALARPRLLPAEEGHLVAQYGVRLVLHGRHAGALRDRVFKRDHLCRGDAVGFGGGADRLRVGAHLGRVGPLLGHRLGVQALLSGQRQRVVERRRVELGAGQRTLDRRADDEGVVARVDVVGDEGGGLGVGARDDQRAGAHHVGLQPRRVEPVAVLLRRDQHLAAHVAALLGAR
mmetsp:Transcript_7003/g.22984  ORF Transcript_7003/g.22984 Transcript_7003/m.22984 type:complete len:422 (+) Transcript_7003:333-1598(+)